jgi:hypothetical protein
MRLLIKIGVALAVIGGLGWLFVRSAQNVRSEPCEIARAIVRVDARHRSGAGSIRRAARPAAGQDHGGDVVQQVFSRTGESLSRPVPTAIPLVLQSEFDRARAGTLTADVLLASARAAGLESSRFEPRCMAHRRISAPGITRQVYFLRLDWPALAAFREQAARQMRAAGGRGLEPSALSPIMIVAATDAAFGTWLPLSAESTDDCLAPMAVK